MATSQVLAQVLGEQIRCTVTTAQERQITISGKLTDIEPVVEGDETLRANRALITNSWAYAKLSSDKVTLPSVEEQNAAAKQAEVHQQLAAWIADFVDNLTEESRQGWCSACITKAEHRLVKRPKIALPVWVCKSCGSPTVPCAALRCENMATDGKGLGNARRFCAEHRHDLPSFERAHDRIDTLVDYKEFLTYDKRNFSRLTKVVGFGVAGIALAAPLAIIAAPALGGAIGVLIGGYSGAAATSFGLALLGGGSLAAGGLGMAGGTMVLTALGAAIGGGMSASITSAYVQQDKSFHIEMLKGGAGTPVVICNGFMSEEGKGWGEWKTMISERYPESPVYRVHWGAKELKDLGFVTRDGLLKEGMLAVMTKVAVRASKIAVKS